MNNTLEKTNAETKLREMFPMFNMDGLIQGIRPEISWTKILCLWIGIIFKRKGRRNYNGSVDIQ